MKHPPRLPLLLGLLTVGAACGGHYNTKVPDDMVRQLPYENKIDLLEAENDLFIAYDKVDETENEVTRTRDQIRRAKRAEGIASDEVGQAKDPATREIAQLTVDEVRARIEYLRALRYELRALPAFDQVQVCTPQNRRYLHPCALLLDGLAKFGLLRVGVSRKQRERQQPDGHQSRSTKGLARASKVRLASTSLRVSHSVRVLVSNSWSGLRLFFRSATSASQAFA